MSRHKSDLKDRIEQDLERYGQDILGSEELNRAYQQRHHTRSTLAEHTLRVAAASLAICYFLHRIHVRTDLSAVVQGSLCHDLGMLGRDEKYASRKDLEQKHPSDSVDVAREMVDDLSEKTADIIERHMWPSPSSKSPNSLEGVIVSLADKYAAVKDLVLGSNTREDG